MRVGLATVQRGRRAHLARQLIGVAEQTRPPERHVVLTMDPEGDAPPAGEVVRGADGSAPIGPAPVGGTDGAAPGPQVVRMPVADGRPLPLSAARNAAIAALGDVDLAVLLDVDCVPHPELVSRYAAAAACHGDHLLAGPVGHLPPGVPDGPRVTAADRRRATPAPARPVPPDGAVVPEPRHELFWSLSFAIRPAVHAQIGGFDEAYVGYGGEDTDYAFRARRAGVGLAWVGGAWAHHQHHPVSSPPREHLADVVQNARVFRERWGRWPMEGWLRAFADEGLVAWDPDGELLELRSARS